MVEFWKPRLVPSSPGEQVQASSEGFPERNRVALLGIFEWFVLFEYIHLSVAPEPLASWHKELEGLVLKLL